MRIFYFPESRINGANFVHLSKADVHEIVPEVRYFNERIAIVDSVAEVIKLKTKKKYKKLRLI